MTSIQSPPLYKNLPNRARLAAFLLVLLSGVAHAALDVEDLMSIAWEGMWHQSGSPIPLRKWNQPLRVRLSGDAEKSDHRKWIDSGLEKITEAAKLQYVVLAPDDTSENVLIEVVDDSPKLGTMTACNTNTELANSGIKRVEILAKAKFVYECMLHEFGHMIGITGHPSGRTVMTYFNHSSDELSDYDRFIIKTRYSRDLKHGDSPFRVLRTIGERYAANPLSDEERVQVHQNIAKFMASVRRDMEKYALENGEPPLVIYRSGLISTAAAENGRTAMQYYLGEALIEGNFGTIEPDKALISLKKAAANKSQAAAWSLAWRHQTGKGFRKDPVLAYAWYAYAASLGIPAALKRQQMMEEGIAETDLAAYKEAAETLQARIGELASSQETKP